MLNANASAAADVRATLLTAVAASASSVNTSAAFGVNGIDCSSSLSSQIRTRRRDGADHPAGGFSRGRRARRRSDQRDQPCGGRRALVIVVAADAGSVNTAVLASIFSIVDDLADSQLAGLAAGSTMEVTSPAIKMRCRRCCARLHGTVRVVPLTAPGSASSFAPMPAGLFDKAGNVSGGVRMQFASLSFDPFPNVTTSGITRLAFTRADGNNEALNISDLSTPVYFNMSAVALGAGQKARCQFWDIGGSGTGVQHRRLREPAQSAAQRRAVERGLARELSVHQRRHRRRVDVSGALAANCKPHRAGLLRPDNAQVMFPEPALPFQYPAVKCRRGSQTRAMVIFAGSRCELINANNSIGCYWATSSSPGRAPLAWRQPCD
jgi:hypothetical protein